MCSNQCYYLLKPYRDLLIEEEIKCLKEQHAPHYREIEVYALKHRAVQLVEAFLGSLEKNPIQFVKYIDQVASERFSEGFFLEEMQGALNILAEKSWEITVREIPELGREKVLSHISAMIGAAKDQLARVYCRKLERSESRIAQLEARSSELLEGTISPPEMVE